MTASEIAKALIEELDDTTLDLLAERLRPRLDEARTDAQADGWLRGAQAIASYLDCPVSRVYSLASAGRIAVEKDGSALIARRSALDAWIRKGGAKRP